jgi:hypothetical protein
MNKIYEVSGTLNKGFVGQISYTICLDKECQEMDIAFSFDKQRYTNITEELKHEILETCGEEYKEETATDEALTSAILGMKTEIQMIAYMNDKFIGCIHKQLNTRHMYFSPKEASEGYIEQPSIQGVIKVTLVVFNVLMDGTSYNLALSAR